MNHYDLIVIGAGPGGYMAALEAAKLGLSTAVVESREAGGTCLNRGCIPTKALLHAAQVYAEAKNGRASGVIAENLTLDLPAMFAHQQEITQKLSAGIEALFKKGKIALLRGQGTITGAGQLTVTDETGAVTPYTAERILIATGSVPALPPIPGLDLPGVLTSDDLLKGADRLYDSIVIIGGGVIGVEFATFYNQLGCKVTLVEGMDRILPGMDREISQNLALILKKQGIVIHTSAMVQQVEKTETGLAVAFIVKDQTTSVEGEVVLCAIGRWPNTNGLFGQGFSLAMEGRRIAVNDRFETSVPGIYAIGDVSSRVQLAHVATAQGLACVRQMAEKPDNTDLTLIPGCIYCRPEIASVGLTEAEAKEAGMNPKVGKSVLFSNARTLIGDLGRSFMKVVANGDTGAIIGAQLMCQNSTDMISQLTTAIANGMSPKQLLCFMRPHPTFEEALTEALEDLAAKLK
ncbi:MAG: dihydrolipoyl dehydrogenase [Clostridia bacterium]|nr:dihydrolipoyl dehydrogenase [Clostridia bacterium]